MLSILAMVLKLSEPTFAASSPNCVPFPPPSIDDAIVVVTPAQADTLPSIIAGAEPHTTILLEDGVYSISSNLNFGSPHLTLRSASGNADAVVLDGEYRVGAGELIRIAADHATVADLTIRRAWYHPVHIVGGGDFVTLYNLKIRDGRQQFVKVNSDSNGYADFGLAACLDLQLTPEGRTFVEQNPSLPILCYTGGFDLHETWGWTVRDSTFRDLYCTDGGLAEHAIHFFRSNREPLVERNLILNCARGIGFGLGQEGFGRTYSDDPFQGTEMEGRQAEVMQIGGTIRNNIIYADIGLNYDSGIGLESAWKPSVLHNTIYSAEGSFNSAIDIRFSGSVSTELRNNLYYPVITVRNGAPPPEQDSNILATTDLFLDFASGELHLAATAFSAIDQGSIAGVAGDFDGDQRDSQPDVGADEFVTANAAPLTTMASPVDGSSYDVSTPIWFAGTAVDEEEGDLTAGITWSSSLDGTLGIGGSLSMALSAGPHAITAEVMDIGGLVGSAQADVAVISAECPLVDEIAGHSVVVQEVHRAVDRIEIASMVTVESSGELALTAGKVIELGDGLTVLNGGVLLAAVSESPCD